MKTDDDNETFSLKETAESVYELAKHGRITWRELGTPDQPFAVTAKFQYYDYETAIEMVCFTSFKTYHVMAANAQEAEDLIRSLIDKGWHRNELTRLSCEQCTTSFHEIAQLTELYEAVSGNQQDEEMSDLMLKLTNFYYA